MKMTTMKILILGDHKVGKSAVTVRFLTKRFIGEYCSSVDHVYRSCVYLDDVPMDVEVLDTCSQGYAGDGSGCSVDDRQVSWADAVVLVYSICSRRSFHWARQALLQLSRHAPTSDLPVLLLLANQRDLQHRREVGREEGDEVASEHGCQYREVTAAENAHSVRLAFQGLLREVRLGQQRRASAALPKRRRGSLGSVGKMLGAMFGKASSSSGGSKDGWGGTERRLSLSRDSPAASTSADRRLSLSSRECRGRERVLSAGSGGRDGERERRTSPLNRAKDGEKEGKNSGKDGGERERKSCSPDHHRQHSGRRDREGRGSPVNGGKDSDGEHRRVCAVTTEGGRGRKAPVVGGSSHKDHTMDWRMSVSGGGGVDRRGSFFTAIMDNQRTVS